MKSSSVNEDISAKYPHLSDVVASVAEQGKEKRIAFIRRDRFVPFGGAERILDQLEALARAENSVRAQGRLIIGESLMGKSTVINEFVRNHPASDNPEGDAAIVTAVRIQVPDIPRDGIYREILSALNVPLGSNSSSKNQRRDCVELLRAVNMKILFIDELHNLLAGSANEQKSVLQSIKYLMNELGRPVVAAGTKEAQAAIRTDPQMLSRLRPLVLSRFSDNDELKELLVGLESLLPLQKPSQLADPAMASRIYALTDGITGHVSDLLNEAAVLAIEEQAECITIELLDSMDWIAPSRVQEATLAAL